MVLKRKILLRGLAAGLVAVLCWHVAVLAGWLFDGSLAVVILGAAAGLAVLLLLRQRGLLRFLLSLLCGLAVGALCMWLSTALDLVPAMLSLLAPGFGRMTAAARYAILVTSAIFYGIVLVSLLVAFAVRPRGKPPRAEGPAEYPHLTERYARTPGD